MAGQENQQYTVLYGRLSQEDERAGESNSIQHQRTLLEKYAKEKGFENTIFLADDGYSGTNFERPSWKKIVEMIEAGQVANLIVKDASRLGREYLQVGYYMEIYFPQKNVRFIAVNDGVDSTVESSNDFNPIRNWANELHAKDTSRKVRAVMKMKAEQGERLGGRPPYGYHITSAIAILKAKKSKRNNDVRTKLYPQPRGDFFCFTAADETLLPQAAKHGDDAEIICVWVHSDSSFFDLI